ncbi:seipin isoform X2 [Centruroides vittatus]|uniref:seipin isoform X2 n=1 Tax=Centruroides vittatus TaxID=120091 RepID=UPI00350FAE8C
MWSKMIGDVKRGAYKFLFALVTFNILIWLSVFLYGMFYYLYIPAVAHFRPVYFHFDSLCSNGTCNFPVANVTLVKRGQDQLLSRGQSYIIVLDLEMPESETNQNIGMFMVKLDMLARNGEMVKTSCRAGVLHFKSHLHRIIRTLFFAPLLLSGTVEEKQLVSVSLFEHYEEDPTRPAFTSRIEIQSHSIEIYAATLRIHAEFTGLRYFMYYWPIFSAVLGIGTNFFFLAMISLFSWFRFLLSKGNDSMLMLDVTETPAILEIRRIQAMERLQKERKLSGTSESGNINTSDMASEIETIGAHDTTETSLEEQIKCEIETGKTETDLIGIRKRKP